MNPELDGIDFAATVLAHDERHYGDAVVPPIFQTSLFTFASYDEMAATFSGKLVRPTYSRGLNPTVRAFEEKIAELERTRESERAGRTMDHEREDAFERLRGAGYM